MQDEAKKPQEKKYDFPTSESSPTSKANRMSIGGFVENVGKDAFDTLKGLYQIIPGLYLAGRYTLTHTPEETFESSKNLASAFKDAIIEPYQKYGLKVLYYRPMTSLLDALTIWSMGAGSIAKVAKVGKLGKLEKLAISAGELPGKLARGAINKSVLKLSKGKYDLVQRRGWLDMARQEKALGNVNTVADMENVGRQVMALSPEERALWHKIRTQGGTMAELRQSPKVEEAFTAYRNMVERLWQPYLKGEGFLTDLRAKVTVAKKMAAEINELPTTLNKVKWKDLVGYIDNLEVKPVYGPSAFERAGASIDDFFKAPKMVEAKKVGFLEKYTGAKGAIKDPAVYVPRAIAAFRQLQTKINIYKQTIRNPAWVQAAKRGEAAIRDIIQSPILQKYLGKKGVRERLGAKTVELRKLKGEVGAKEAARLVSTGDAATQKRFAEAANITASPTIKRLLQSEFSASVGGPLKLYDVILGLFRKTATKYNPGYVTGNAVGDALLGTLYGADWLEGWRLRKIGAMPAEVTGVGSLAAAPPAGVGGFIEKWGAVATAADQATRAGIVTRAVYDHLAQLVITGERAFDMIEPILRSTDEFAAVQIQLQRIEEQIVRGSSEIRRRDKLIAELSAREQALSTKIEAVTGKAPTGSQAALLERITTLQNQQAGIIQSIGVSREIANKAIKEVRKLVGAVAPADLRQAVKREMARYRVFMADQQIDSLVASIQEQVRLSAGLKEVRSGLSRAKGNVKQKLKERVELIEGQQRELEALRQKIVNVSTERDEFLRDMIDDFAKSGELEKRIPGLAEQAAIVRKGIAHSNAFVGDYLGLSGFEQAVARRLVPFYPWVKAMTMLAFRLPFISPVKTFLWNRFAMALMSVVGDKDLPEYAQGAIPVFALADGRTVWIKLSRFSPFSSLRMTRYAGVPIPNLLAVGEQNPLFTLDFKFRGGRTIFEGGHVPYGEQMVNIANGDTYEFTERGTLRRVIPQAPLVSGVAHMFPVTQLIEELIAPWVERYVPMGVQGPVRKFMGLPRPYLKPDGTYRYPHELWQTLTSSDAGSVPVAYQS